MVKGVSKSKKSTVKKSRISFYSDQIYCVQILKNIVVESPYSADIKLIKRQNKNEYDLIVKMEDVYKNIVDDKFLNSLKTYGFFLISYKSGNRTNVLTVKDYYVSEVSVV